MQSSGNPPKVQHPPIDAAFIRSHNDLIKNYNALEQLRDDLQKKYLNKFVAIYEGKVRAHAKRLGDLLDQLPGEVRAVCAIDYIRVRDHI